MSKLSKFLSLFAIFLIFLVPLENNIFVNGQEAGYTNIPIEVEGEKCNIEIEQVSGEGDPRATHLQEVTGNSILQMDFREEGEWTFKAYISDTDTEDVKYDHTVWYIVVQSGWAEPNYWVQWQIYKEGSETPYEKILFHNDGKITLGVKVVDEKENNLKPVLMGVEDKNGTDIFEWRTSEEIEELSLNPGTYVIKEKEVPKGYERKQVKIEINEEKEIIIDEKDNEFAKIKEGNLIIKNTKEVVEETKVEEIKEEKIDDSEKKQETVTVEEKLQKNITRNAVISLVCILIIINGLVALKNINKSNEKWGKKRAMQRKLKKKKESVQ